MTESPLVDLSFNVPVFSLGDDLIACLNKAVAFLTIVASSKFPSTNNQLRTSSNPRNQASIQDGRVITEDLDTYDSDCDDISNAKAVLMANISNYGSDVISEDFEQSPVVDFTYNEIHSDSNIIPYSKYFSHEKMIDSQIDDMIKEKLALKEQVDSLEQNLSKQIKEKECLLQTVTVFKSESKEKEDKYMENEIDLEKKIKELDNIIYKVGQSAQTVHILSDDFGKHFTPQQELSTEQVFLLRMFNPTSKPSDASLVKIEAPKELPKFSLVNESLKKLKFHLARFDNVVKIRTTPDARTEEFFENNDLKAQLQDKDTTICKLKDIIKSMREKSKEENDNYDYGEIQTKNVELENNVAKLITKNERLCNEINHVKRVFKEQFDSIKKTCVRTKEHRKEIVDIAAQIPSANNIVPGMFKLDLEPLAPSAKKVVVTPKNKVKKVRFAEPLTSSSNIKQVESSKTSNSNTPVLSSTGLKCSTSNCGSNPRGNKNNDRISQTPSRNIQNKVEAQPRKVNKKNSVIEPIHDVDVKHSLLNANSEPICATCKKSMFDCVHDMCLLDFVENVNSRAKSAKKHKN
ncbi:hypothetical protein Tco_0759374 [Tanacetum coccineum]